MAWPLAGDYQEALQNPAFSFSDPELKASAATLDAIGLPRPTSGAFATVFQVKRGTQRWAVRCFLRELSSLHSRYAAISNHLKPLQLASMVQFEYQPTGIRIRGQWYPILKMEWIDGVPLSSYLERQLHQPEVFQTLAQQWKGLLATLRQAGVAHGDLQHGNVLMSQGQLRLIDYDGFYVPTLRGAASLEEGHRHYQHAGRQGGVLHENLDTFSAWVIYYSMLALSYEPRLWQITGAGDESLLFRQEDYKTPQRSMVLRWLENHARSELQAIGRHMRWLITQPLESLPPFPEGSPGALPLAGAARLPAPRPAWLDAEPQNVEPEIVLEVEPIPTPDRCQWVEDHLVPEKWPEAELFGGDLSWDRRLGGLALGVVLATNLVGWFGNGKWAFWGAVLSLVSYGSWLGLRYRQSVAVRRKRVMARRLDEARQKLAALEKRQEKLVRERDKIDGPLHKLLKRHAALPEQLALGLQKLQTQADAALEVLREERTSLQRQQLAAMDQLDRSFRTLSAELSRQWLDLPQDEQQELDRLLDARRRSYLFQSLAQISLMEAALPGIGHKLKRRLADEGYKSAAQIDSLVSRVEGIGMAKAQTLLAWKQSLEAQALLTAPTSLSPTEIQTIQARMQGRRKQLENEIAALRTRIQQERLVTQNQYTKAHRRLDAQEAEGRERLEAAMGALDESQQAEKRQIIEEFRATQARLKSSRERSNLQIRNLLADLTQARRLILSLEYQVLRYRQIRPLPFVRQVLQI